MTSRQAALAREERLLLTRLDEHPLHQITQTFAGVAGSDPQWNDGHYFCLCDDAGQVCADLDVRLYQNNDVLDGFVCLRHEGRQHNIRVSRRLRPDIDQLGVGPLRIEIVEPMRSAAVPRGERPSASPWTCCATPPCCRTGPGRDHACRRPAGERAHDLRDRRALRGLGRGGRRALRAHPDVGLVLPQPLLGHAARPRRPAPVRRAAGGHGACPACGSGCCSTCRDHGGFFFVDPSGRGASGRGRILLRRRAVPVDDRRARPHLLRGRPADAGGTFALDRRRRAAARPTSIEDLGWVYCQGGGYFGGFDDGLGQGVYRGDYHFEGEVWDVSHPTQIVDADGKAFEFDHDWAESFVRLPSEATPASPTSSAS